MNHLPQDFMDRMKLMLGDSFQSFLDSYEKPKFSALRVNTLKTELHKLTDQHMISDTDASTLEELLSQVPWCENGYYYPETIHPGKHIYHEAGAYYIQEPSAMSPATYLAAKPYETILDLCAAPGGKSTQIASMMQQKGLLVSNEIHPARAKILAENIERMGIKNAVVTNEAPQALAVRFPAFFDRIMVDAPCSGEGMFRKNDDAKVQWSLDNVTLCAQRQDEILDCADQMLKPGGRIVFSTCTFAPAENEGSIGRFMQKHPEYILLEPLLYNKMSTGLTCDSTISQCPAFQDEAFARYVAAHVIRLWPHKLDGEGHFVAILQKGNAPTNQQLQVNSSDEEKNLASGHAIYMSKQADKHARNTTTKSVSMNKSGKGKRDYYSDKKKSNAISSDPLPLIQDFLDENLLLPLTGRVLAFGEQYYLLPEGLSSISGLKCLRPGLHLGTLQKDRFEPSHALALYLKPQDVKNVCTFTSNVETDYLTACHFIEGQTFPYEGQKGWYLICLDGLSIGWGRLAGGIMKNYYPKGLRKYLL